MMATDPPRVIRLNEHDQVALLALMFAIMNADLSRAEKADDELRAREAARGRLRLARREVAPDGKSAEDPLDIEASDVVSEYLAQVESEAHSLLMLAQAVAYEPWIELHDDHSGPVDRRVRRTALTRAARWLPGQWDETTVQRLEAFVWPSLVRRARARMGTSDWFLAGGLLVAGAATAGIAAPVIGAAIGGAMGLQGAAAATAGLAALGGGSVAAGGFGMAGGTAVICALGGLGGGTLGVAVAETKNHSQVALEVRTLRGFVNVGREAGGRPAEEARVIESVLECEIGALIANRAREALGESPECAETEAELSRVVALRRAVSPVPFELPS